MTAYQALKEKYSKVIVACEICASRDLETFQHYGRTAEPGVYGEMPVTICKCCGFKMQNPRYEDQFYIDYYDVMYREIAFGATKPSDEYIEQQKARGSRVLDFAKRCGVTKKGKMLDHGCASGATMLGWRDDGWDVSGIDPHRPSVEEAKLMGLDVRVGAGENLPCENEEFDLILSLGSTEHSYNLEATMREMNRALKNGGKLVIRWRSNEIFGSPLEYFNHNHYRFFTRATWELCLKRYGFSVDVMSNERVEGWDSYEYIIATKETANIDGIDVKALVKAGPIDDYKAELTALGEVRESYYAKCKKFLELNAQYKDDPEELVERLRSEHADFKWGWLGGQAKDVVARSAKEAQLFLTEYEAGRVK